jgi:hypothetical protein
MISANLKSVRRRILESCEKAGRSPEEVNLVCVTKEAALDEIMEVLNSGVKDLGENRVQDAILKYRTINDKASWHMVGHLQTNKVNDAVKIFSLIHSVDSIRLAKEMDKEARKINKIQGILIQVNVSEENTKFGIRPEELKSLFKEISSYPNINIKGLMTIAPEVSNPELARPYFRRLREIKNEINRDLILSMGMSNDFDVAIEEGSDIVRIGRAIFGDEK